MWISCGFPASIPIQVLHFTSSQVISESPARTVLQTRLLQSVMLDNTCSLGLNCDHINWCTQSGRRLCIFGVVLLSLHSQLWGRGLGLRVCEREVVGWEVSFNTSMKIPAFTSSPMSFPMGPNQVPLRISPPEFCAAAQWTGLIPYAAPPPT